MTLCPASCKQSPAFKVCPLKDVIGDYVEPKDESSSTKGGKGKADAKKSK